MKKLLAMLLTVVLMCSMSVPAFAAQEGKENNVTVKYVSTVEGEYRSDIENGKATAAGVTVTNAPSNAKTLVVIPMESEAFQWIDSCVDGNAKAAYDIHFEDVLGNRINANGASVSVAVSGSELTVSSVNTSGMDKNLSSTTSGDSVSFTADGNPYYVIFEKDGGDQPGPGGDTVTVPVRGDDNEIHADVTLDGDTVELHELDFAEIDHIIGDKDKDGLIEIDLTKLDEEVIKIALPMASIKHIVEAAEETHNEHEHLQIDFPYGSVTMDDKTLRAIIDTVGEETTVDLMLESVGTDRLNDAQNAALNGQKIYGGFEAYLVCNNTGVRVSDFKGGVATLSVPFEIPNGLKAEKFAVWYVADDGTTEKLETWHDEGQLHWSVGHFSDFIVTYEGEPPHEHSYEKLVTAPTCTEKGFTTYTCSCGESYVDDYTSPTGHSFTKYESNNDATCDQNGTETAKCDHGCGEARTRTDYGSKLGHKYENDKCTRCGASRWNPKTGDAATPFLWAGLLILSVAALCFLFFRNRRNSSR